MIGIESIVGYIPPGRINNLDRLGEFDVDKRFVEEKIGVLQVAAKDKNQDTSDLCIEAVKRLQKKNPIELMEIDCLVVCTQNPDRRGLPQTSAIVHDKLSLSERCAVFDISLGCSGYVYSLSIIQSLMEANSLKKGLLFTSDPYSKIIDPKDKSTSMLFGDASAVTLLGNKPIWKIGKAVFGSKGDQWQAIHVKADGRLSMHGRDVFNFAVTTMPKNIKETLDKNGLSTSEIDLFALHQGSKFIIDILRKRLGVPEEKMPFVAADYGNTVSSSIPLIVEKVAPDVQRILVSGFGVGLSWGSLVLEKVR